MRLDLDDESALHAGHEGAKSGGGHFRLTIVSPRFRGAATVARHRLVYDALGPMMQRDIHALAIKALTPEEASDPHSPTPSRRTRMKCSFPLAAAAALVPRWACSAHEATAQDKGAAPAVATRVATVNGVAIPKSRVDAMVRGAGTARRARQPGDARPRSRSS